MLRFLFRLLAGSRLPTVDGELAVPGLAANVTIRRDAFGVPHIEASNDHDAAFAFGFVQAQDRGGQLETLIRIVRGTLCEVAGERALPMDRLTRRIGFARSAAAQYEVIDADVREFIDAFAAGINAGFEHGFKQYPHEFQFLKCTPTQWHGRDILGYVKYMSFQLPSNWDVELARFLMLREDGPNAVAELDPCRGLSQLLDELKALDEFTPRGGGSNNWAVDGTRSATGKPLLASDPHLGPTLPNPWYLAHIVTPSWKVAGAAFAGTPVFPIAHNEMCCWGVTAGLTDTTDLFIETLEVEDVTDNGPTTQARCLQPDGTWVECEVVRETIRIRDGADVVEEILITPRGPIVTPLIPGETLALSLQAVWLKPRKLRGFFDAAKATSFESFRAPFAAWPVLPLNVLYADKDGIGYQLVGDLPIRSGGNGLLPTKVSAGDWSGFVDFADMPTTRNPKEGLLTTANDDPAAWCGSKVWLGQDFVEPYRAMLIREELALRTDWTPALLRQLQLNLRSKPWEELKETVLAAASRELHSLLSEWDGYVTADSPAAALFEVFLAYLAIRIAKLQAPSCWKLAVGGDGHGHFANSLLADRRVSHLIDTVTADPPRWKTEIVASLESAANTLRQSAGPSPPYWAWGHQRTLTLRHPLFGKHRWLKHLFTIGPVPIGGDSNTIAQAASRPLNPLAETHNIPNLRTTFDPSDWSNNRFALAGGQSGNPVSPHFSDQFPLWQRGDGIAIPWTPDQVTKATKHALRLKPL